MEAIQQFFGFLQSNIEELSIMGAIMVSAIIVFIGILKPLIYNRIKWKPLRKAMLSLSTVAFSFAATAIYFLFEHFDKWDYYIQSSIAVSLMCIITYWIYEGTCFKDVIDKIGQIALRKAFGIFSLIMDKKDKEELEQEFQKAKAELMSATKVELKKVKKAIKANKDFENL